MAPSPRRAPLLNFFRLKRPHFGPISYASIACFFSISAITHSLCFFLIQSAMICAFFSMSHCIAHHFHAHSTSFSGCDRMSSISQPDNQVGWPSGPSGALWSGRSHRDFLAGGANFCTLLSRALPKSAPALFKFKAGQGPRSSGLSGATCRSFVTCRYGSSFSAHQSGSYQPDCCSVANFSSSCVSTWSLPPLPMLWPYAAPGIHNPAPCAGTTAGVVAFGATTTSP